MQDIELEDVECDGLGQVLVEDSSGKTFFNGFINHSSNLNVYRGDCVRIRLDEVDEAGEDFAFGQVTAVFVERVRHRSTEHVDEENAIEVASDADHIEEKLLVEIRWMHKPVEPSSLVGSRGLWCASRTRGHSRFGR